MASHGVDNKLLIVDGSTVSVDLLSYWLRSEDFQIFTAANGMQTMAKLAFLQPGIIVINVDLPDMSGFDLCKRIKQETEESLILCLSNLESEHHRFRAEEMGADDYFETSDGHYLFVSKIRSLLRVLRLSRQLHDRYTQLQETNALLKMQLEMGMQVQRALIPDINMRFKECTLMSRYYPAMGIGGDFYNVLHLSDDSFAVVMGDVSGHGIAAAFLTALLNMMIKNIAMAYPNPNQLLFHLNNEMCSLFEDKDSSMYACVFYAMVNTTTQTVRYANGGSCFPFHVDVKNNKVEEMEQSGRPVGLIRDTMYRMRAIDYQPGDLMFFYTDGLQDTVYKGQPDEFNDQLKEVLSDMRRRANIADILDAICDNFYQVPESENRRMEIDDASMILCRL
jgi:sigma-B regulation protein RsbU (phosphoserine phosphatase)